jgi:hypothetical protein
MSNTLAPPATMRAYVGTPAGPVMRRVADPEPAAHDGKAILCVSHQDESR